MKRIAVLCRRSAVLLTTTTLLHACGGGGAAPPSAPEPPPVAGTPPGAPPSSPSAPASPGPQQPAPPTPSAPPPAPAAPSSATIETPNRTFSPSLVTIAVNGTVTWRALDDDHEIRFTSAAPHGGSLGELEEGTSASRTFTATGTYDFECERHRDKGMRGRIVVVAPGPAQPPPSSPPPSTPPPSTPPSGSSVTVTTPNETFSPAEVTIPTGGSVTWQFSQTRHNVTFQGASPAGGNIPDQDSGTSASRTFAVAGTYSYVCTRHSGMTGRVVVQ
jgi:plastocyanin